MQEIEEKKLEKKRELERIQSDKLKRMTPEQQAKFEEKKQKKEQTRSKGKLMKVMK